MGVVPGTCYLETFEAEGATGIEGSSAEVQQVEELEILEVSSAVAWQAKR